MWVPRILVLLASILAANRRGTENNGSGAGVAQEVPVMSSNTGEVLLRHWLVFHPDLQIDNSAGTILRNANCNGAATRVENKMKTPKRVCTLFIHVDHSLYKRLGSEGKVIKLLAKTVTGLNKIYRKVDFNGDGRPDKISFSIKGIRMESKGEEEELSVGMRRPPYPSIEDTLMSFSEGDYSAFCLAFLFTYQSFANGTGGYAWKSSTQTPGGICEHRTWGTLKGLNSGLITFSDSWGNFLPSNTSIVALAHEVGHAFGATHDERYMDIMPSCTPATIGDSNGNYLMTKGVDNMFGRNSKRFSSCSLNAIRPMLAQRGTGPNGCFQPSPISGCGGQRT